MMVACFVLLLGLWISPSLGVHRDHRARRPRAPHRHGASWEDVLRREGLGYPGVVLGPGDDGDLPWAGLHPQFSEAAGVCSPVDGWEGSGPEPRVLLLHYLRCCRFRFVVVCLTLAIRN
ncbi:MAG: hypothetical protein MZV63_06595, partial [Marinilabiliales bacterium]|nr:hypothetical protein [Marinilabiliales bacterium]